MPECLSGSLDQYVDDRELGLQKQRTLIGPFHSNLTLQSSPGSLNSLTYLPRVVLRVSRPLSIRWICAPRPARSIAPARRPQARTPDVCAVESIELSGRGLIRWSIGGTQKQATSHRRLLSRFYALVGYTYTRTLATRVCVPTRTSIHTISIHTTHTPPDRASDPSPRGKEGSHGVRGLHDDPARGGRLHAQGRDHHERRPPHLHLGSVIRSNRVFYSTQSTGPKLSDGSHRMHRSTWLAGAE